MTLRTGTAGWSIPRASAAAFPQEGTHLQRYSRVFPAVEINSSFYRPHATGVYRKWALQTPDQFRFSVKVPRTITHEQRLCAPHGNLDLFLEQVAGLGDKLGTLLVQLPPSLDFNKRAVRSFFARLRATYGGGAVCEPRHPTWFSPAAERVLQDFHVARVAADPAIVPAATVPGGWPALIYFRLHGSPRMYWSRYTADALAERAAAIRANQAAREAWCIFDNTAAGAAVDNALELAMIVQQTAGVCPA